MIRFIFIRHAIYVFVLIYIVVLIAVYNSYPKRLVILVAEAMFFSSLPIILWIYSNKTFRIILTVVMVLVSPAYYQVSLTVYSDIVLAIKGKYKVVEGYPSQISVARGIRGAPTESFTIKGAYFKTDLSFNNILKYGNYYRVTYLPTTNFVIDVQQLNIPIQTK